MSCGDDALPAAVVSIKRRSILGPYGFCGETQELRVGRAQGSSFPNTNFCVNYNVYSARGTRNRVVHDRPFPYGVRRLKLHTK